jgi:hypothetical protein
MNIKKLILLSIMSLNIGGILHGIEALTEQDRKKICLIRKFLNNDNGNFNQHFGMNNIRNIVQEWERDIKPNVLLLANKKIINGHELHTILNHHLFLATYPRALNQLRLLRDRLNELVNTTVE